MFRSIALSAPVIDDPVGRLITEIGYFINRLDRQPTDKQLIEAVDKAIRDGTITGEQMEQYLDLIDDMRGDDANRVYTGPPIQSPDGMFRRGKLEHR